MMSWKRTMAVYAALGAMVGAVGCDGETAGTDASVPGADTGGACPAEVTISGEIDADTSWDCPAYVLSGRVFVVNDATLTIAAGTTIYGDTGGSDAAALVVTRGARLVAEGTETAPIVFTSGNPEGARASGDWAGVVLLGAASTNDGNCVGDGDPGTEACDAPGFLEDRVEGIESGDERALYGGADDASDCGALRYVRIEFAGRELSPDNELNGLTVGGCGSGTDLSYVHVHRGKDDGIEFFGGTASMHHVLITGASDDSLDFDEGWRGNVQFLVVHQYPGVGDRGFEADNLGSDEDAAPRTRPTLFNVTMIGEEEHHAMLLREGMQGVMGDFLVVGHGGPPDVVARQADPALSWPDALVLHDSVLFDVAAIPPEDLSEAEVYEEARAMDPTLPATRPSGDDTLSPAQREMLGELERERLDDDMGFDESASLMDGARNNVLGTTDPMLGSTSATAPDYMPANADLGGRAAPSFNEHAPAGFGDASATYAGAIAPNGTDWTLGWTAYPAD